MPTVININLFLAFPLSERTNAKSEMIHRFIVYFTVLVGNVKPYG